MSYRQRGGTKPATHGRATARGNGKPRPLD
nr:MAG TPA: hypothetical protein [Caudoviricetes sp.]